MRINVTPGQVTSLLESLGRVTAGKMVLANELTETEAKAITGLFQPWKTGEDVKVNDLRQFNGELYKCNQPHTTQADWTPDVTPALWTIKSAPGVIPAWVQPEGSHDAYSKGDLVTFNGEVYESTINANTWSPADYPAGWIKIG